MRWKSIMSWVLAAAALASTSQGAAWDVRGTRGEGAEWAAKARDAETERDALAYWVKALKADPGSGEALNGLGRALLTSGRAGDAAKVFARLGQLWPEEGEAQKGLSAALLAKEGATHGDVEAAEAAAERAVELSGGVDAEAWHLASAARHALGDYEGGLLAAERAVEVGGGRKEYLEQEQACLDALEVFSPLD